MWPNKSLKAARVARWTVQTGAASHYRAGLACPLARRYGLHAMKQVFPSALILLFYSECFALSSTKINFPVKISKENASDIFRCLSVRKHDENAYSVSAVMRPEFEGIKIPSMSVEIEGSGFKQQGITPNAPLGRPFIDIMISETDLKSLKITLAYEKEYEIEPRFFIGEPLVTVEGYWVNNACRP